METCALIPIPLFLSRLFQEIPLPISAEHPEYAQAEERLANLHLGDPGTRRVYHRCLVQFQLFLGASSLHEAIERFFSSPEKDANAAVELYLIHIKSKGLSVSTHDTHLSALRFLVKIGSRFCLCPFELERKTTRRDQMQPLAPGPNVVRVGELYEALSKKTEPGALRDYALLRLLFDVGLKTGEAIRLDCEHLSGNQLLLIGNGKRRPQTITLPEATQQALLGWLSVRGASKGPLFSGLAANNLGGRLSGTGISRIVGERGKEVGLALNARSLRNAAIYQTLSATKGNLLAVRRFARHRGIDLILACDDALQSQRAQAEIAELVCGSLDE
jgi:integrase